MMRFTAFSTSYGPTALDNPYSYWIPLSVSAVPPLNLQTAKFQLARFFSTAHPNRSILALAVSIWHSSAAMQGSNRRLNPVFTVILERNLRASCSANRQVSLVTLARIFASESVSGNPPPLRGAKAIDVMSYAGAMA